MFSSVVDAAQFILRNNKVNSKSSDNNTMVNLQWQNTCEVLIIRLYNNNKFLII